MLLIQYSQKRYAIAVNPLPDVLALEEVDQKLQAAAYLVSQIKTAGTAYSETSIEGTKAAVLEAVEFCTATLSATKFQLIDEGNVLDTTSDTQALVKIEAYQAEVERTLVRLSLDAGIYTRRKSAYLSSLFFLKKNRFELLVWAIVIMTCLIPVCGFWFFYPPFTEAHPAAQEREPSPAVGTVITITNE